MWEVAVQEVNNIRGLHKLARVSSILGYINRCTKWLANVTEYILSYDSRGKYIWLFSAFYLCCCFGTGIKSLL